MDVSEIKQFITENKDKEEVSALISDLRKDGLVDFLKSDEGFTTAKPFIDSKIRQALDTYKEKTVPSLLEEQLKKKKEEFELDFKNRYGVKDPDDPVVAELKRRLDEQEKKISESERAKANLEKANAIKDKLAKIGLEDFTEMFLDQDVDSTVSRVENFQEKFEQILQSAVEARVSGGKLTPPSGNGGGPAKFTLEQIKNMSPEEYQANRETILELNSKGLLN